MVGNNNSKILTVSYGTFSCTLEGFEDSFGTMKAIAEYFRDLAADDRYFGAEPPSLDTDMLARIAEKQSARRVEAYSENGEVVLRSQEVSQDHATEETPTEPTSSASIPTAIEPADLTEDEDEENDEPFFTAPTARATSNQSTIAERLERIRAAALHEDTTNAPHPGIEDAFETELEELESSDVDEESSEIDSSEASIEDAEFTEADTLLVETVEDEGASTEDESADDEFQALLDAVASGAETVGIEDEPEDVDDIDSVVALDDGALEGDDEDYTELLADEDEDDFDEFDEDESDDEILLDEENTDDLISSVLEVEDFEDEAVDLSFDENAHIEEEQTVDSASLDAIFAEDDSDEDLPETVSGLSAEDEEDLLRELAAVEAADDDELDDAWDEVEITDEENLFVNNPEEALANAQDLSSLLTEADADNEVSRLIAETEEQLAQPEGNRRRNTIAHLKRAVAAKRADMTSRLTSPKDQDSVPYHEDLVEAVKPNRPALTSSGSRRPLTPLRLVAEQKIEVEDKHAGQEEPDRATHLQAVRPVRPRRVATGTRSQGAAVQAVADPETSDLSFEQFAEEQGVDKLPELLEAAASFVTFVEGLGKFSRPQIMSRVRAVMGDQYSREDGLRAFGQLLREGKLKKLDGGRFTVSDGIGFQP